eukprot:6173323-Pleurochrysis_carterae.AAC.1
MSEVMASAMRGARETGFWLNWIPRHVTTGCQRQTWRTALLTDRTQLWLSDAAPRWRGPPYLTFG